MGAPSLFRKLQYKFEIKIKSYRKIQWYQNIKLCDFLGSTQQLTFRSRVYKWQNWSKIRRILGRQVTGDRRGRGDKEAVGLEVLAKV